MAVIDTFVNIIILSIFPQNYYSVHDILILSIQQMISK